MKFKDFTEEEIVQALKSCSGPKGKRCSTCPIFGKGFQGVCVNLLMQRAAKIIESKDIQEVKHGKWIEKEHWVPLAWDSSPFSYDPDEYHEDTHCEKRVYWHCNECDYEMSRDFKPNEKYCPNCGAKMDLE